MVNKAKEKVDKMAGEMDDMVKSFDPNDPQFEGMTEEEIRAKELENSLFDELTEMQDEAMGKLSDMKKSEKILQLIKVLHIVTMEMTWETVMLPRKRVAITVITNVLLQKNLEWQQKKQPLQVVTRK